MRLKPEESHFIRTQVHELLGADVSVKLFGSRLHDDLRGGDVDLFLDLPSKPANPALLAATLAGKVSRHMRGRKVDVVIAAPGLLSLPIHEVARTEGLTL
ncbi:nucleotidyltransferase domain-containing protein [Aquabacterium sp. A08]|uniref:nucleotidyltransferase domain-containing protein n=1 Tax=Aquabacterium sp. A08 TaxID=2718532 RepID=UPI00141F49CB|nr:nucleotidyltransferase domain-containing protein [Aquabacterium sp. A08]NIC43153.1 nucleotidyltransferase domain-containing protein [Aquabacterium sp. A08]